MSHVDVRGPDVAESGTAQMEIAEYLNQGGQTAQPPHGSYLKPTRAEAEEAVRTLIRWAGDDPGREGLKDTPGRVVRAYEEWFSGYAEEPSASPQRTFEEVGGYDEVVILRDIEFHSYCEHHNGSDQR